MDALSSRIVARVNDVNMEMKRQSVGRTGSSSSPSLTTKEDDMWNRLFAPVSYLQTVYLFVITEGSSC